MDTQSRSAPVESAVQRPEGAAATAFSILVTISFCHLLNDMMQSLLPAVYPILKANYALDFGQIGLITFAFQFTASLLQPVIGYVTDRWPQPYSLVAGMGFSLVGLLLLSSAGSYPGLLLAAALVGSGSAVLHPESSRVARMAAGSQPGLAQAVFQLGGNLGSSLGPLFAAVVVLRNGQSSIAWFGVAAVTGMVLLALSASASSGRMLPAVGAVLFALSDVAVARDRFVKASWWNRACGLPLYYAAQFVLAGSVSS